MTASKFLGTLLLGIAIGAGGLYLYAANGHRVAPPSAADTYNACLEDAKIGMLEQKKDVLGWFSDALAKCAKQYRLDRENEKQRVL